MLNALPPSIRYILGWSQFFSDYYISLVCLCLVLAEDSSNRSRDKDEMYKPFKARPMPSSTKQSIGVGKGHKSVSLMEARPFPLMSEERGRDKQALPAQRLLAQQKQVRSPAASVEGFGGRPLATYGYYVDLLQVGNRERVFCWPTLVLLYYTILQCYVMLWYGMVEQPLSITIVLPTSNRRSVGLSMPPQSSLINV